jgi:hypothetical protein
MAWKTDISDVEQRVRAFRGVCKRFKNLVDQVFSEVIYLAWGRYLRQTTLRFVYYLGGHSFDEKALLEFPSWDAYKNQFKPFLKWNDLLWTPRYIQPLPEFDWVPPCVMNNDFEDQWRRGKVQRKKLKINQHE